MSTPFSQPAPGSSASDARFEFWQQLRRQPAGVLGLIMLLMAVGMAIFAAQIAPYDPYQPVRARLDTMYALPSAEHPWGTDDAGKDVLSQFIYGARVSLFVGFSAALITVIIGGLVGLVAGYFGGWVSTVLMRITDIFLVIPDLPLYVVLVALLGPNIWNIILAIAVIGWTGTARVVYSQTLSVRERLFIKRAKAIGASDIYILFRHILPAILPLLLAQNALAVSLAILSESGLAFIGLGDPRLISWGTMLNFAFNRGAISIGAWWAILPPGLGIVWVVLAWTLLGYVIEEIINPRGQSHHLMPERKR